MRAGLRWELTRSGRTTKRTERKKKEKMKKKKCARNVPGMCVRDVTQWETVRNCADNVRNCADSVRNCADSVRNCAAALRAISRRSPGGTTRCIPKISRDV